MSLEVNFHVFCPTFFVHTFLHFGCDRCDDKTKHTREEKKGSKDGAFRSNLQGLQKMSSYLQKQGLWNHFFGRPVQEWWEMWWMRVVGRTQLGLQIFQEQIPPPAKVNVEAWYIVLTSLNYVFTPIILMFTSINWKLRLKNPSCSSLFSSSSTFRATLRH